ncbi:uncharacterized protein LOC132755556 [Ruditapes philippinarum]|uniref:uncharacterized protein LOC132755556 n=1 Tax=Ruditapes philippinarum TaxID=129788 RepID=UPI00295BAD47|nr:uncharacterized protein LOC132755556 [Ruditapes philippinarum]
MTMKSFLPGFSFVIFYFLIGIKRVCCGDKCGQLSVNTHNTTEGKPVIFHFVVSLGKNVTWQKKLGSVFKNLEGEKYHLAFDGSRTTHSLSILETKHEDTGEYRVNCGSTVSNSIYLNIVYSKPSVPVFSNVEAHEYCTPRTCIVAIVNKLETIECTVKGGSRDMTLNLLKNNMKLTNTNQTHKQIYSITHFYIRYSFIPSQTDTDIKFTCTVKDASQLVQSSTSVVMYIIVPPNKIEVNVHEVIEGEEGEVQCIAMNGRPPLKSDMSIGSKSETYTKTKNTTKPGNLYDIITWTTRSFTRDDNQKKILCCSNIGGKICGDTKINVLFKPKLIKVVEVFKQNKDNGDTNITLKFSVEESNPKSSIVISGVKHIEQSWVDDKIEQQNKTYGWTYTSIQSFIFTRHDNSREIKCEVKNEGFPDLRLNVEYTLDITYYPIVTISEKEQKTVYVGDDVDLTCNVDSNPPSTLSWQNQTGIIKEIFGEKTIKLYLTNVSTDHSKTYSCKARNGIGGIVSRNITLIVKDPSERQENEAIKPSAEASFALVIGPIIGCILVIIIAVIVALIVLKKRQNKTPNKRNIHEINIEERNENLHPTGNDPTHNNIATSSGNADATEQPEYACVIPKKDRRKFPAMKETNDADNKNNERGDNLVYADLDLAEYPDLAAKRPLVTLHEQTEYVSIDFSKTGAAAIADSSGDNN